MQPIDRMNTYPVLMYHGVHEGASSPGHFDPVYSVTPSSLSEQLDWLTYNGYRTVLLDEVFSGTTLEKVVVVTFDDGDLSNYLLALPLLEERKMVAEFFITTDRIGKSGSMSAYQLADLASRGMSIQSHGVTHRFLSNLSEEDLYYELSASKAELERVTNRPVSKLSLPGGRGNNRVIEAACRVGYRAICSSEMGHNSKDSNCFKLRRITVYPATPIRTFHSIVTGHGMGMAKLILRERVLHFAKLVFGNQLYERLRGLVVPR